jgi:hypothetical protein
MLERLSQEQFEHILDLLILYKQTTKGVDVYLNERSIKEAINFMNTVGKQMGAQLGLEETLS